MKTIKAKVHRLPTENNSHIHLDDFNFLHYSVDKTKLRSDVDTQHLYITTDEEIKEGDWCYDIIGNDVYQWKKSDWDLERDAYEARENSRKIIATTDLKLNFECRGCASEEITRPYTCKCKSFPKIPQSFIEEYCKAGGIDEVLVEYEPIVFGEIDGEVIYDWDYKLKLNPDNTIIIHPVEEKIEISLEKLKEAFGYYSGIGESPITNSELEDDFNEWIEENL